MNAILRGINLSKNFGGLKALHSLNFSLYEGEIVGLIGPNGAGKTTLFNLISGIYKPDSGNILFQDEDIINYKPHEICKKGIARTFQIMRPFYNLTILENVLASALNRKKEIHKARDFAFEILSLVGLMNKKDLLPKYLPISDIRCLELARALATEPKLLLLDETLAGLNPKEQESFILLIKKLRDLGITIFVIEHAMRIIMTITDRIIVLNYGEKIAEGSPKEISSNKQVIEAYLGKGRERWFLQSEKREKALLTEVKNPEDMQLIVKNINVFYGKIQALYQVSLEVKKGEIVALIGSNGAGKTTTINTITGLLTPQSGQIVFTGKRIDYLPPYKIVEMGIVQVPEGRKIFPNLTVEENLDLGAYIEKAKIKRSESIDRVLHLFPPLKNRISQKAGTLSGGEQQMLAIAQGIMCCPKLLILDEPSLGLAPIVIEAIFMGILDINSQGTSILLAEQNIYYSLNICQRAYVLENGRLIMEGEGASLLKDEYVKKSYLGA